MKPTICILRFILVANCYVVTRHFMASHFNVLCNHCLSELDSIHYLLCTFEVKRLMLISIDRIESILIVTCFRFFKLVVLVSCLLRLCLWVFFTWRSHLVPLNPTRGQEFRHSGRKTRLIPLWSGHSGPITSFSHPI